MGHTVINLLEYSKKHTADQKAGPVCHKPSAEHDDTPGSHNEPDPKRRSLELHEDRVRRYFKQDVRDEEHHVCNIVVGASHVQVFLETFDFCISEIGTNVNNLSLFVFHAGDADLPIDVSNQVQRHKHRHETPVDLAEDFLMFSLRVVTQELRVLL